MSFSDILAKYRADWCLFIKEVLGISVLTDSQRDLVRSVQTGKRTLGQSGHAAGKTFIAACIAHCYLWLHKDSQVILTSSSQLQVSTKLWAEFSRLYRRARVKLGGELTATRLVKNELWYAMATATNDGSNLQGSHGRVFFVMDEAQAVEQQIWDAAEAMMGSPEARTLALFNPLYAGGPAHTASRRPGLWKLVKLSCMDHPNVVTGREVIKNAVTREWVEDAKRNWGEDSPLYISRVLGEFPDTSENNLVSLADLETCAMLQAPLRGDGTWLGVDVARYGSDLDWAMVVNDGRVIAEKSWHGLDLMRTCGMVHELVRDFDVPWEHVNVDGAGVGGGVIDRLREQGLDVNDVQFGGKPEGDWDSSRWADLMGCVGTVYRNRKAELHWIVRSLLKRKLLSIPKRFERCWEDLLAPRYESGSDGSIKVESKEDLRKRLKRSPDAGDALVLAMSRSRLQGVESIVQFA